jgi:hypothetical protein
MKGDSSESTPEEMAASLEWLRARGVEVETPEDRRLAKSNAARSAAERAALDPSSDDARSFTYVLIPSDPQLQMEQRTAVVHADARGDGDVLATLLKRDFTGGTVSGDLLATSPHVHQMAGSIGDRDLTSITPQSIKGLGGSTETLRLAAGTPREEGGESNTDSVALYIDEVGALKKLPINARASALAARCGYGSGVMLHGDAFVGRLRTTAAASAASAPLRRAVDFVLDEMHPSSPWVRTAAAENLAAQAADGRAGGVSAEELRTVGGEGEGYTWSQSGDGEVEVIVPLPSGTRSKQCKIVIKKRALTIAVASVAPPVALDLTLWGAVNVEDSTWCVSSDEGGLVVTLEKGDCDQTWPSLVAK